MALQVKINCFWLQTAFLTKSQQELPTHLKAEDGEM